MIVSGVACTARRPRDTGFGGGARSDWCMWKPSIRSRKRMRTRTKPAISDDQSWASSPLDGEQELSIYREEEESSCWWRAKCQWPNYLPLPKVGMTMYICECDPPWLRVEPDTEFLATLIWTLLKTTIYRATNFPFFFLQGGIIWLAPVLCTKVNVTNRIPQHKFSQPSSMTWLVTHSFFVGYVCLLASNIVSLI